MKENRMSFKIESDSSNWILYKIGKVEDEKSKNFGNETKSVVGYFGTIEQMVKYQIEKSLKINGLKELVRAKQELTELCTILTTPELFPNRK